MLALATASAVGIGEWELGEGQEGGSRERPAFTVSLPAASSRRRWW